VAEKEKREEMSEEDSKETKREERGGRGKKKKKKEKKVSKKKEQTHTERRIEGIKKTVIPSLIGMVFGTVLGAIVGDGESLNFIELFILVAILTYVQKFIFPYVGVSPSDFETKDWFYVGFMTFAFILVSWTMYINA